MSGQSEATWAPGRERQLVTVARNVSTRYLAIIAETVIGLVMLPFNLRHLGAADYGLWVLLGSITVHFSVLDLGYAGALVKFMAQYRAHRNAQALNEIASTLFFVFAGVGLVLAEVGGGAFTHALVSLAGILIMWGVAWVISWYKHSADKGASKTKKPVINADMAGGSV